MTRYSHSRLSTFEQCTWKYKLQYIDKIKPEITNTIEAFLGSRVHEALEKLYKDMKFEKLNTVEELIDWYNSEWEEHFDEGILIVRSEYTAENYKDMGERFIREFCKRNYPFNQTKTLGLETEDFADLDGTGKYMFHIRIDRLAMGGEEGDVYEIHDYKTANTLMTQDKADQDRQLAIYAYGVKQKYPDAKKVKLFWHYLAFDKVVSSDRTDEELDELRKKIIALIDKVEANKEWEPTQSALCGWCNFKEYCPCFKHEFQLNKKREDDEFAHDSGEMLVDKFIQAEKEVKEKEDYLNRVKTALIEYAKANSFTVVSGTDFVTTIKSYPRLSFPKKDDPNRDEFLMMIKNIGLWEKFETVDVFDLAKAINKGEIPSEIVNLIEPFITRGSADYVFKRKK